MHRIDSATARADANGEGKAGFHDNGDLPNQDATYFTPQWANAVQEEIAAVVEEFGIPLDKASNGQLLAALVKQFGEKKMLEDAILEYREDIKEDRLRLDELEKRTYADTQIGELFWTEEHFLTSETVAEYKGYGTWARALQGRVAVGFSDNPLDPIDFRTHAAEYGEHEHTLTVDEMPEHTHGLKTRNRAIDGTDSEGDRTVSASDSLSDNYIGATGRNQPHNNMPPAKTLDCWKRIT